MSGNVSLQDLVYFGASWQLLNGEPGQTAPIVVAGGYRDPVVTRSADGHFFAGVVEKVDACGAVTDVVLAFSGAAGLEDFVQGESMLLGLPASQGGDAVAIFDQLMADPRYADATIHVTGHSLGAGLTQFILGHAMATYGAAETSARADFVQFAPPPWGQSVANHFNLPFSAFDGFITGYVAQNDLVLSVVDQGATQMGNLNYLAPLHALPLAVGVNNVSAHWPSTFIQAFGLPAWLSAAEQAAVAAEIAGQSNTPLDAGYGPVGGVSMTMVGDGAANMLRGSSAGDVLLGRGGRDVLLGGAGADLFVFEAPGASSVAAPDLIADFSRAQGDRIDLRGISHTLGAPWFEQVRFIGSAALSAPGQVRSWNDGHDTFIAGSFGAGAEATFKVQLAGVHNLAGSDFLLNSGLFQPHYTIGFVLY